MKRFICILVIGTFFSVGFLGCATTSDRTRTKTQGTAAGAGIGAGLGALVGYIIGGKSGAKLGAAIGAVAGGTAGYAYGTHVANQKKKYAKEEDWLNACVESVAKENGDMTQYCQNLGNEINSLDEKTKQLAARYEQKEVNRSVLNREKKMIDLKRAEAEKKLKRAHFELVNQKKVLADARKSSKIQYANSLEIQIEALKKNIEELEGQTRALASMSQRMAV